MFQENNEEDDTDRIIRKIKNNLEPVENSEPLDDKRYQPNLEPSQLIKYKDLAEEPTSDEKY